MTAVTTTETTDRATNDHVASLQPSVSTQQNTNTSGEHNEDAVLAWTASQIAHGTTPNRTETCIVQQENIRPVSATSSSHMHNNQVTVPQNSSPPVRMRKMPPKPPRPQSPPALSPIDYQPYHNMDETIVTQRMTVLNMIHPNEGQTSNSQYPVESRTATLDPYGHSRYPQSSSTMVKRTQTLKVDYANRVRDRVRSLRVTSSDGVSSEQARSSRVRVKKETYVCSDTIKLPKFKPRLKRRQTVPPKTTQSSVSTPVVQRPQTHLLSSYTPDSIRRPFSPQLASDYITVNQTSLMQNAVPESGDIQPVMRATSNLAPGTLVSSQSQRQLTSLRSLRAHSNLEQSTFVMDSPLKGMMHAARGNGHFSAQQEPKSLSLPYFSEELIIAANLGHIMDSKDEALSTALKQTQPFLNAFTETSSTEDKSVKMDNASSFKPLLLEAMRNYLSTCVRIQSMDVQGYFAPFHYPLPSFHVSRWQVCGQFMDWNRLCVLKEAQWNTEYAQLQSTCSEQPKLIYTERSINTMLTNWLDCHHTAPHVAQTSTNSLKQYESIYHPVSFVSDFESLHTLNPYKCTDQNAIFQSCLQLAVLLTYYDCCTSLGPSTNHKLTTDLTDILVAPCVTNCLVLFRVHEQSRAQASSPNDLKQQQNEETENAEVAENTAEHSTENAVDTSPESNTTTQKPTHILLQSMSLDYATVDEAIDDLLDKIYDLSTKCLDTSSFIPALLKAVAPPDWIAILIARLHIARA